VLAGTGIFAVIANAVGDRRREIGVRVALGATPAQVAAAVGRHGANPAVVGAGAGLVAAALAGRVLASSLYGVRALDAEV
jgi:ABC-type transport system, involved in lipoprotein release, permease component